MPLGFTTGLLEGLVLRFVDMCRVAMGSYAAFGVWISWVDAFLPRGFKCFWSGLRLTNGGFIRVRECAI